MIHLHTRDTFRTMLDADLFTQPSPGRTALIFVETGQPDRHFSQQELFTAVCRRANSMRRGGVLPHQPLIIANPDMTETIISFLAALINGCIPSVFPTLTHKLHADIYARNLSKAVESTQAQAIATDSSMVESMQKLTHLPIRVFSQAQDSTESTAFSGAFPSDEQHAFLQYSSGTTGLPKCLAISHRSLLNQLASLSTALGLNTNDRIISWLPLYHDMGLIAGFLLPILQGIPLILMSPLDWVAHPALLLHAIKRHQATLCWQPNFAYVHLARRIRQQDIQDANLISMRLFINCSETVMASSHAQFLDRFAANGMTPEQLGASYAMAENTFAVTQTLPGEELRIDRPNQVLLQAARHAYPMLPWSPNPEVVSCGRHIAGTEIRISDRDGALLPERSIGEVCIRGNCLFDGYTDAGTVNLGPAETWHRTGDIGYMAEGELFLLGRIKDMIIYAGRNIHPQDIEAIANEHPAVHAGRSAAFGLSDANNGTETIVLLIELKTPGDTEDNRVCREIRQQVSEQTSVSARYVQAVPPGWLIKTSSGKISRSSCRKRWLDEFFAQ